MCAGELGFEGSHYCGCKYRAAAAAAAADRCKKIRLFREAENLKTRVQFLARYALNGSVREGLGLNADSQGFLGIPGRLARNPPANLAKDAHPGSLHAYTFQLNVSTFRGKYGLDLDLEL